ncbi:uncharacterized protein LOC134194125 [Corticium candelabrum]|uniref:uncharacterized protein LOC134194125 n=1 Tax=Corticium candelabrum TaxID=121492 RepID=UPI002E258CAF|nr:uncharacterized protein LOC134194125 [Corticium candelabrum]
MYSHLSPSLFFSFIVLFHVLPYDAFIQQDACEGVVPSNGRRLAAAKNKSLPIAALIPISSERTGKSETEAFCYAVRDINDDDNILADHRIVPLIYDTKGDPWTGLQSAIDAISNGTVAIVGPGLSSVATTVSPLATRTHIPFVTPTAPAVALALHDVHQFVLQLSPSDKLLSRAVVQLVKHFKWQHVGIIRSSVYYGRNRFGNIYTVASENGIKIVHVAEIPSSSVADGKQLDISRVTQEIKQLKYLQARIIVVDVLDRDLEDVFRVADKEGMIGEGYVWIVSSESLAKVSNPKMEGTLGVSTAPPEKAKEWQKKHNITSEVNVYQLYTYDAVWLLARALDTFIRNGGSPETVALQDDVEDLDLPKLRMLKNGTSLVEFIRRVSFDGFSGEIKYNPSGETTKTLDIVNIQANGSLETVGKWNSNDGIDMDETNPVVWSSGSKTVPLDRTSSLEQTVYAMVMVTEPFVFYKDSVAANARFSGYLIDVLEQLQNDLGFEYHLEKWNGTHDELVMYIAASNNPYTVAIADVIITSDRWKVVDFTTSLHLVSLAMLLKAPEVASTSGIWGFLAPFHYSVWLLLLFFFIFSAIVLRITEAYRIPHQSLGMGECLWMSFSVFFGTHKDDNVTSMFGRGWLIVTLMTLMIINAAYTAVLTTFLLSKEIKLSVTEVQDLLDEQIGTIRGTQTTTYLRNIEGLLHLQEMNYDEAVESVVNGSVKAFISSRVALQYLAKDNCDIYVPSTDYDIHQENIALVVQKGSVLTPAINTKIQEMWDSNYLSQLYKRHSVWTSRCDDFATITDVDTIDLNEVGGIFIVLLGVTIFAVGGQMVKRAGWIPGTKQWRQRDRDKANTQEGQSEIHELAYTQDGQ